MVLLAKSKLNSKALLTLVLPATLIVRASSACLLPLKKLLVRFGFLFCFSKFLFFFFFFVIPLPPNSASLIPLVDLSPLFVSSNKLDLMSKSAVMERVKSTTEV